MARTLAELKAKMLADPAVQAAYEERWLDKHRHPAWVREVKRAFRAKQRAADLAPLSTKVVYPRKLVDAPPPPKKGRQGK